MEKGYYEDIKKLEEAKQDPNFKYKKSRNEALNPHKELNFADAIVYVNGERCMKKKMKINDGDEIKLVQIIYGG